MVITANRRYALFLPNGRRERTFYGLVAAWRYLRRGGDCCDLEPKDLIGRKNRPLHFADGSKFIREK